MRHVFYLYVALVITACSGEADIGIDENPVTCRSDGPTAEVEGSVTDPSTGTSYTFGAAAASASTDTSGGASVSIGDDVLLLRLGWYCQTRDRGQYDLVADGQRELVCPIEVAGAVLGRIEYLPVSSGVVIVDESSNCMAGRFRADFGEHGELSGWFSAPWQP
jgi:hypothetical protein